jgi:hypothetical protein
MRTHFLRFINNFLDTGRMEVDMDGGVYLDGEPLHITNGQYLSISVNNRQYYVHNIVAYIKYGTDSINSGIEIRHKNDDKHDNSWNNILIGTKHDNTMDRSQDVRQRIGKAGGESSHKRWSNMTDEQYRAACLQIANQESAEQRSMVSRYHWANIPVKERSDIMKAIWVNKSKEERTAIANKIWQARRAHKSD